MGYSLLWLVILSCAVKAVIQNELGRYAIATGETGLEAMNRVPGPRFLVGWVVWLWFLMQVSSLTTLSAMFAGVAEVLNMIVPGLAIGTWVWVIMSVTMVVLMIGRYRLIETVAVVFGCHLYSDDSERSPVDVSNPGVLFLVQRAGRAEVPLPGGQLVDRKSPSLA